MILNQWYAILPSKTVKKDGILAVKRLNLHLALFRNKKGELGCVTDQCTHRGAALSKGCVKGDCLQCPFHGIEFDKNGKCVFIPANGKASTEDLSRYNVKKYLVSEEHGIIYFWYGDEEKATGQLPFFTDYVDDKDVYSEIEDPWNSHYSRSIENQLDVVHVPIVHYNTIGRGNKTLVNGPKVVFENGVITTSASNEVDNGQKPKPAGECEINPTFLSFMFPNLWMNHIAEKIKVIIFFAPVDDENTVLYIRFYGKITGFRPVDSFIAYLGKFANLVIERQDKRIVTTQKPKASSFKTNEKLVAGDGPVILYRKLRDELQNGNQ
jgi:phenylpropionate dioxygenase-like ring-hydroxylating dioxygenase large terminal subunit